MRTCAGGLARLGADVRHGEREVEHALLRVPRAAVGAVAANVEPMIGGNAVRWRQATTLPRASRPALRRCALTAL